MSLLIDKYNIINTSVFSEKSNDVLLQNILTNNLNNFDLEILISIKSDPIIDSDYRLIIKNIVKKYSNQLKYQLDKNKKIDIHGLNNKIYEMLNRIQLIHSLTKGKDYKKSEKRFGDIDELKKFASDFKNIIIDDKNIRLSIFKQIIDNDKVSYGLLKNLKVLDSYYSFYEDFLDIYSTYLADFYNIDIPKTMKHLYLTLMLETYNKLFKFKSMFKSERYLIDYKMKILNTFSEFMDEDNLFTKEFIVNNPTIIGKIFKMSEDINYKTDLFLNIFVVLDKGGYLSKNLTKVFDFVIKLTQKLDKVKTNFIKKILMIKMLGSDENMDIIVDSIISGNIKSKNTLELISVNDMTVNHFHELIKQKITPLIINREITTSRIVDLVNLFKNSKFNRLSHDLEIIQNDFTFSKFFTSNINNEFNRENNIYVINPNFWALNFSEGFIEMDDDMNQVPKKNNNIVNALQLVNDCYKVATDDKRKFSLLAHLGSINFDYTYKNETLNIIMLPIQSIIFQQIFGESDGEYSIKRSEIYKNILLSNYKRQFIDEVIDSLLHGGIVEKSKSPHLKSQNFLCIGTKLSTMKNDYVEILFGERIQESIKYIPVFDHKTVISCWINKFVKTREYKANELLTVIKNNLDCGSIVVTDEMFYNTIKHMKDNDYIEEKDGKIVKLFY